MPKKLLIVRHAKSDWNDASLPDFKRPLNSRGHDNAPEMAQRLAGKKIIPQQIVSSPAKRAITTAAYFAEGLGLPVSAIKENREIYEASLSTLMKVVNELDNRSDFTALFGHNPGITSLVFHLTGNDLINVPTCGIILIGFPFDDWRMVSGNTGELIMYDYPKSGAG